MQVQKMIEANRWTRIGDVSASGALDEAAETDAEKELRQASDVLKYCDSSGRCADFHSNRHLFITSLERANLSPKMAQTLARHSDVRLTLGVYTHVGLHDQTAAIHSLPSPPSIDAADQAESVPLAAKWTIDPSGLRRAAGDSW